MEILKEFIGKQVFCMLKSGRKYTGVIQDIGDGMVVMIDRYNEKVMFAVSELSSIEEEGKR